MKYNLENQDDVKKAFAYLTKLATRKSSVDIIRLSPRRSLSQNSYLHLLLTAFGNYFGYNLEEAKMVYKYLNADIYRYKNHGLTFWRSSADLTKEEMTQTIEKLRAASAKQGYELPKAEDREWVQQLEIDVERNKPYAEML